ncbi:MAG: sugar phosphate isomerase/epimerase [Lachnospiraceae bacterium]|nr:sugar phosphate isomerase/epimerase [Lachnospiraceae bacterium]
MKISVFYNHIQEAEKQTGRSRIDIMKELKAAGIDGVELGYQEYPPLAEFRQELAECGMEVSSIYRFFHYETDPDPAAGRELVEEAAALGCRKIMPIPGFYLPDVDRETVCQRMVQPLTHLVACAAQKGISVVMEDFDSTESPIATSKGMKWFADRIPGLFYTFDCGNFYYSGEEELSAFDVLRDKILHVHCKDRALAPLHGEAPLLCPTGARIYPSPFGSGVIKTGEIMKRLKEIGYDDYLVIEHFGAANQMEYMLNSAKWLKEWIG